MKRKLLFILLFISIGAHSQTKPDSITNLILGNPIPIYEFGMPLTSCETNFENLFKNWNPGNVTNAREYELLDFSFVETIADSVKYSYYRNYFSGGEPVYCSVASFSSSSSKLKKLNGKIYNEETEISERFIRPGYIRPELFDQRGLPAEAKEILSEEFVQQARELLMREINIDTLNLKFIAGEISRNDTIKSTSGSVKLIRFAHSSYGFVSTDSISQDYVEMFLKSDQDNSFPKGNNYNDLTTQKRRALALEELLIWRITSQVSFNKLVHFGDKVYVVRFRYHGAMFSVYVVCNPETKKVVMDTFFKNITIRTRK